MQLKLKHPSSCKYYKFRATALWVTLSHTHDANTVLLSIWFYEPANAENMQLLKFHNIASHVELLTMTLILAIQDWGTIPNACFPRLWYQHAYLCTPPLSEWHQGIRVTSGYRGDISKGGMHYPNRTINLSQLTVNHCRHGTAWWCLLISRVIALEIDFVQNLSKYLHQLRN